MFFKATSIFFSLIFVLIFISNAQIVHKKEKLDVLSYHVHLRPDIEKKEIAGDIEIRFKQDSDAKELTLSCGHLTITSVTGQGVESYLQKDNKVVISFSDKVNSEHKIQIFYHGKPERGVEFSSDPIQMYTVFFTDEWMVCNDTPNDRASINIDLFLPSDLTSIANGILTSIKEQENGLMMHSWSQEYSTPAYTYGFVIGSFNEIKKVVNGISLNQYSPIHSKEDLEIIFDKTAEMIAFFEEKSGLPFDQESYSQVLIGNHYQEMSGFAILKESYGDLVLMDSTETNLISHELAHQWWGNMITCESWSHFWLNEGFATFLSAAYNEHRFGKEKYNENIDAYFQVYQKIKDIGADRSLVFTDWLNPSRDDRNLVYFKGAYVLHLLKEELGEEEFWKGVKSYSQQYFGKSVTTIDFQKSMEISTGKSLQSFFNTWVY